MNSILKQWVTELGLRHQGCLLSAVRGCDDAPKDDPSKLFIRCFRSMILNSFCGDPSKAASFVEEVHFGALLRRFNDLRKNLDHYPHHYVMHLIHAIEIIGYYHPDMETRENWNTFYRRLVAGLHLNAETKEELDKRLCATEDEFGKRQWSCDGPMKGSDE